MAILSSASDLHGSVSGISGVMLTWTHPDDIVAQNIVFDVFASKDPLDLLAHAIASGVAATSALVPAVPLNGAVYFTVVARRGDSISLPAKAIVLNIESPPSATTTTTACRTRTRRTSSRGA